MNENEKIKSGSAIGLCVALVLALGGCAQKKSCKRVVDTKSVNLSTTTKRIENLDTAIKSTKSTIATQKSSSQSSLFPPNAKEGECYARVLTPARYRFVKKKVLAKESSQKLHITPARYRWVNKRVLVKEASKRIVSIPAKYATAKIKVLVTPKSQKIIQIPAVYEYKRIKVKVTQEHTEWKIGRGPIEKLCETTGEILCLVKVPATYIHMTKKVLKTPPRSKIVEIPATYRVINKKILLANATTKVIDIPAVYKTIKVKELIKPASIQSSKLPETYQVIQTRELISKAKLRWQKVMCKSEMTTINIKKLQIALKKKGFNPGPIDGIMGWRTKYALQKFQQANSLSVGSITYKTLEALEINR